MRNALGIALYGIALAVGVFCVEAAVQPWPRFDLNFPDGIADKYLTVAAWDGSGTALTMDELARRYGLADWSLPSPVTRTPGTFIVQAPLILLPDNAVIPVLGFASVLGLLAACWAGTRLADLPLWVSGGVAVLTVASTPMLWAYLYGTTAVAVAAFVALGWVWKDRPRIAGVLLGIAAVLKVWPALLILIMWRSSRRTAWTAAAWIAALTVAGLTLPGTQIGEFGGSLFWLDMPTNWSLVRMVGLPVALALGTLAVCATWWLDEERRIAIGIGVGLAVSPLSWPWYWVAIVPAVAAILKHYSSRRLPSAPQQLRVEP